MPKYTREEVANPLSKWRQAVDRRDISQMASMLTPDARGGNSEYGIFEGRDAIVKFAEDHWPESVPNRSVWHAIDDCRVVDKRRETLPGEPPSGRDYHYYGISELRYAGSREWNFMYGIPDVVGWYQTAVRSGDEGSDPKRRLGP